MKKYLLVALFAVLTLSLSGCDLFQKEEVVEPNDARRKAEQFINDNLMPEGVVTDITSVKEEHGLYKLSLSFSNGNSAESYISKDGKIFFPESLDMEEVANQVANANTNTNATANLQVETTAEGTGEEVVAAGDSITVDYVGTLEDGTQFDSSIDRGEPFTFTIGQGAVIQGWEQGLLGMKVGEERHLVIPADLGYGASGSGNVIPPNATLIFDVKLISIN